MFINSVTMQIVPISTNILKCKHLFSVSTRLPWQIVQSQSLNSVPISVTIYLKSKQAKGLNIHLQACSLSQILNVKLSLGHYG